MTETSYLRIARYLVAIVAVAFGLLTIWSGGAVLFGGEEARQAVGDFVPFVVWSNFVAGFFYVVAGVGLWQGWEWARWVAVAIAGGAAGTYFAFGLHVLQGGLYEVSTVVAMAVRTGMWIGIALFAFRLFDSLQDA